MPYIENEAAIQAHIRNNCMKSFNNNFKPAHVDVDWELAESIAFDKPDSFIGKIISAGRKYTKLSDKQLDALKNALAREIERRDNFEVKKLEWALEAQKLRDAGVVAPSERVTIVGDVKTLKWSSNHFGDTLKMLVVANAGWKVWCSVPSNLVDDIAIGCVVQFDAKLTPKEDDALFAWGSRPTKGEIIQDAA